MAGVAGTDVENGPGRGDPVDAAGHRMLDGNMLNAVLVLMSIELMLAAVNLNLVAFGAPAFGDGEEG